MHVCILHHSTKQQLHNHLMDLDILDMVCQKDSEDEESEGEDDPGLVESIPTSSLDVLRGRVKENLELLHSSAPIDASPLVLSDLREKFPQVIYIICMFTISCQFHCSLFIIEPQWPTGHPGNYLVHIGKGMFFQALSHVELLSNLQ